MNIEIYEEYENSINKTIDTGNISYIKIFLKKYKNILSNEIKDHVITIIFELTNETFEELNL